MSQYDRDHAELQQHNPSVTHVLRQPTFEITFRYIVYRYFPSYYIIMSSDRGNAANFRQVENLVWRLRRRYIPPHLILELCINSKNLKDNQLVHGKLHWKLFKLLGTWYCGRNSITQMNCLQRSNLSDEDSLRPNLKVPSLVTLSLVDRIYNYICRAYRWEHYSENIAPHKRRVPQCLS